MHASSHLMGCSLSEYQETLRAQAFACALMLDADSAGVHGGPSSLIASVGIAPSRQSVLRRLNNQTVYRLQKSIEVVATAPGKKIGRHPMKLDTATTSTSSVTFIGEANTTRRLIVADRDVELFGMYTL